MTKNLKLGDMWLYNWVFHFNPYTGYWNAVRREDYTNLFSNQNEDVLRSKDINTLLILIRKTNGDKSKLKSITQ